LEEESSEKGVTNPRGKNSPGYVAVVVTNTLIFKQMGIRSIYKDLTFSNMSLNITSKSQ